MIRIGMIRRSPASSAMARSPALGQRNAVCHGEDPKMRWARVAGCRHENSFRVAGWPYSLEMQRQGVT